MIPDDMKAPIALMLIITIVGFGMGFVMHENQQYNQTPHDAIAGSAAVADVTVTTTSTGAQLSLTLAENAQQQTESCDLVSCYETRSHSVEIQQITVHDDHHGLDEVDTYSASNGGTLTIDIPVEDGSYVFELHSEEYTTTFSIQVTAENSTVELVTAKYDDIGN